MKKLFTFMIIVAVLVMTVVGCSKDQKQGTSQPQGSTELPKKEVINLRFATYLPEGMGAWDPVTRFLAEELEARTGGQVQTKIFWAGATGKVTEFLEQLRTGVIDMAFISLNYYANELPLSTIANETGFSNNPDANLYAFRKLMELPAVQKEWKAAGVRLWTGAPSGPNVFGTNIPIRSINDFKGLKMRSAGLEKMVSMLGASPVAVVGPEQYEAMHTGVINSWTTMPIDGVPIYALQEVTKNIYPAAMGIHAITLFVISERAYNNLPDDIKKIVDEVGKDAEALYLDSLEAEEEEAIKMIKEAGVNIERFPQALEQQIQSTLFPATWDSWIQSVEAKGLPGKQAFETWKKSLEEFKPTKVRSPWWERGHIN